MSDGKMREPVVCKDGSEFAVSDDLYTGVCEMTGLDPEEVLKVFTDNMGVCDE